MQTAVETLKTLYAQRGYAFFDAKNAFDLNLFGIRRRAGVNLFNDLLGCAYAQTRGGELVVETWPGTTDPGSHYLREPGNSANATAIVVPGQYRGLWKLGLHRGKDPAFVQVAPVAVYRDGDRDEVLDFDPKTIARGLFGINGHHAGTDSARVDNWSAGCQVWKRRKDHDRALMLGRAQLAQHPTWATFTYTLFDLDLDPTAAALFAA
jgi:hypothetical protein